MNYRADIDALRGIAVLSVVLFHLGITTLSGGFVGVDIFFVISGYVIAKTLEADLKGNKFSIVKFYNKRIRRIFPALFATFALTYVGAYFILLPNFFEKFSESLISSAVFVSNMYFWKDSGYFSADALTRPLLHTWSLSVEEQYYIFAPILTFMVYTFFKQRWLLALLPLLLGSLALSIYATSLAPTANFFFAPTRAWELLIGALLAHRSPPAITRPWLKDAISALGLGLIVYALFCFEETTSFPGANALFPCIGAALLIYAGQSAQPGLITRLLSNRLLVGAGLISYSMYLVHWPIIVFAYFVTLAPPTPMEAMVIFAATVALAYLSWRFIEQPFRHLDPSPQNKKLIAGGLIAILIACGAGYAGIATKGFPARFPDFKFTEAQTNQTWNLGSCFQEDGPKVERWNYDSCQIVKNGPEKIMLWGDSFAAHYVPGIIANQKDIPYTVIQYTAAGCPPVIDYYSYAKQGCTPFNAHALEVIKEHGIKKVILSARWTGGLKSRGFDGLRSTLARLEQMGVETYVIGQSPQFSIDTQILAYKKGAKDNQGVDTWKIFFDPEINSELAAATNPHMFIDPLTKLCQGTACPYRIDGNLLYEDYGHFSSIGSADAVKNYLPVFGK